MVETRQAMLAGDKPRVCYSCWEREGQGLVSIRQRTDWGDENDFQSDPSISPQGENGASKELVSALPNPIH
jgi:hypothetical protein